MLTRSTEQLDYIAFPSQLWTMMDGGAKVQTVLINHLNNLMDKPAEYAQFIKDVRGADLVGFMRTLANNYESRAVTARALSMPGTIEALLAERGSEWIAKRNQWLDYAQTHGGNDVFAKALYETFQSREFGNLSGADLYYATSKLKDLTQEQQLVVLASQQATASLSQGAPRELAELLLKLPESETRTEILKRGNAAQAPMFSPRGMFTKSANAPEAPGEWVVLARLAAKVGEYEIAPLIKNLPEEAKIIAMTQNTGYHDDMNQSDAKALVRTVATLSDEGKTAFFKHQDVVFKIAKYAGPELVDLLQAERPGMQAQYLKTAIGGLGRHGQDDAALDMLKKLPPEYLYDALINNSGMSSLAVKRPLETLEVIKLMAPVHQGYVLNTDVMKSNLTMSGKLAEVTKLIETLPQEMGQKVLAAYEETLQTQISRHGFTSLTKVRGDFDRARYNLGMKLPVVKHVSFATARLATALGIR